MSPAAWRAPAIDDASENFVNNGKDRFASRCRLSTRQSDVAAWMDAVAGALEYAVVPISRNKLPGVVQKYYT